MNVDEDKNTSFAIDPGSDDELTPTGLVYELGTVGGNSGLKDETTNLPVLLSLIDGNIVGRIDDGSVWKTALTISVVAAGEVTFTQDRPVVQPDSTAIDEPIGFAAIENLVRLKALLADQNHDPATLTRDITASLVMEDHGCEDCADPNPPTWNPAAVLRSEAGELLKGTSIDGKGDNDTIQRGIDNDIVWCEEGNDFLFGNVGNDTLYGGDRNDFIRGGERNDQFFGGDGVDLFYFGKNSGPDVVHDFESGVDHINVKGLGLTTWAKVQAVLTYYAAGAHVAVDTNHIRINDATSLSASDFIFV